MKCERCLENNASVKLHIQNNSKKKSITVCNDCYSEFKKDMKPTNFMDSFNDIFDNLESNKVDNLFFNHSNNSDDAFFNHANQKMKTKSIKKDLLLQKMGKNLNHLALNNKIDPVIGRDEEINQVIETLNRRNKNNPVLIGEAGVGKTAIAEGISLKIVEGNVPTKLHNKTIYSLNVSSLVSGTSYRGQFEERMNKIIEELESNEDIILFIDEIHLLIGAGGSEGAMDASNILKPALARGNIQIIGATTLNEYRKIEKDGAFERRLQPIIVDEPTQDDAFKILKGIKDKYEEYHGVIYSDEVINEAITLSTRYIQDRKLPDKAIDLLDISGSKSNLNSDKKSLKTLLSQLDIIKFEKERATQEERYEEAAELRNHEKELQQQIENFNDSNKTVISVDDIKAIIEKKTGIPINKMDTNEKEFIKSLNSSLSKVVIGQENAVKKVSKAIQRAKTGLKPKNRPLASFLFVGPTGVGKTELTKTLALELFGSKDSMIRLDMSEYMEKHSVSKLIGSPPGYVGHEEAGQLTEQVRRKPYSIILLDEIEKAHPEVQNMFLQILEDGRLTDSQGKVVNFKETVIIATSNAGISNKKKPLGFGSHTELENSIIESLKNYFRPEFLNRFDNIIEFNELSKENLIHIVDILLADLYKSLSEQDITCTFSKEVKEKIADIGYDPNFGARPLRRAIQEYIEDSISDLLVYEESITHIDVMIENNDIIAKKAIAS